MSISTRRARLRTGYLPPYRNIFTPEILQLLGERDEPLTAGETDVAGPWRVEEIPREVPPVSPPGEGTEEDAKD